MRKIKDEVRLLSMDEKEMVIYYLNETVDGQLNVTHTNKMQFPYYTGSRIKVLEHFFLLVRRYGVLTYDNSWDILLKEYKRKKK